MEKKIRKIRRDIDSNILSLYDKKRQKSIRVMSKIIDGACEQCNEVLSQEIIQLSQQKQIVECPKCGKLLYIEEIDEENLD